MNDMSTLQFVFAAFGAAIAISVASLLWPKLSANPEPPLLTTVRSVVQQTPLGAQAADVLGVSDAASAEPINLSDWAVSQGNAILAHIEESATKTVVSSVAKQLIGQIDALPEDQQSELRSILCATSSAGKE